MKRMLGKSTKSVTKSQPRSADTKLAAVKDKLVMAMPTIHPATRQKVARPEKRQGMVRQSCQDSD